MTNYFNKSFQGYSTGKSQKYCNVNPGETWRNKQDPKIKIKIIKKLFNWSDELEVEYTVVNVISKKVIMFPEVIRRDFEIETLKNKLDILLEDEDDNTKSKSTLETKTQQSS